MTIFIRLAAPKRIVLLDDGDDDDGDCCQLCCEPVGWLGSQIGWQSSGWWRRAAGRAFCAAAARAKGLLRGDDMGVRVKTGTCQELIGACGT